LLSDKIWRGFLGALQHYILPSNQLQYLRYHEFSPSISMSKAMINLTRDTVIPSTRIFSHKTELDSGKVEVENIN